MELTRRDALAALSALGVGVGATTAYLADADRAARLSDDPEPAFAELTAHELATLRALAHVVYPTAVTGIDDFVRAFFEGRVDDRPDLAVGISEAVERLDELGRDWHGATAVDLDPETRERFLDEVGADTAEPAPNGSPAERVRYFLVNELLFALYASPTGGELVGIENPQGHPGGLGSYERGPKE